MKKHFTPDELAAELGVKRRTLSHWRMTGRGPGYVRYSERGPVRYPVEAVEAWKAEHAKLQGVPVAAPEPAPATEPAAELVPPPASKRGRKPTPSGRSGAAVPA